MPYAAADSRYAFLFWVFIAATGQMLEKNLRRREKRGILGTVIVESEESVIAVFISAAYLGTMLRTACAAGFDKHANNGFKCICFALNRVRYLIAEEIEGVTI